MEIFNLKKKPKLYEFKEQHEVKITNRYTALENLNDDAVNISRVWDSIRENTKVSAIDSLRYYELKQHKT
jgi:pyruvate-formate lyase-activating enzyme